MSIFNQMIRGGECVPTYASEGKAVEYKPRTFRETVTDQIAFHRRKITELEEVLDSLNPNVERFIEALQKLG